MAHLALPQPRWSYRLGAGLPPLASTLILALALVLLPGAAGGLGSRSAAAAVVPAAPAFGPAIDPYGYEREDGCSPTEKPGTAGFRDLLLRTYGRHNNNIVRACSTSNSGHEEGRALDWSVREDVPALADEANTLIAWLLATDEHGNQHAMLRRLGIQYIVWDDRIWGSYDRAWEEYRTCYTTQQDSLDSTCHRDHIHFSFSWAGANQQTTWWEAVFGAPRAFVHAMYRDMLGRAPAESDLVTRSRDLTAGADRAAMMRGVAGSAERVGHLVNQTYEGGLGRLPSPGERDAWVQWYLAGRNLPDMRSGIYGSAESAQRFGGADATVWVQAAYQGMLGRAASAEERSGWAAQVQSRGRTAVARDIAVSTEARSRRLDLYYSIMLLRAPDPGASGWLGALGTTGDVTVPGGIGGSAEYWQLAIARFGS